METLKWWSKALLILSVLAILILLFGPFLYKFEVLPLQPALLSLVAALGIALLTILLAIIMVVVSIKKSLPKNRNVLVLSLAIALVPTIFVGNQLQSAKSVPEIHDISTDTMNPPSFNKIVSLRGESSNSLIYEYQGSADKLAAMQAKAYPSVKSINSPLSVAAAVAHSAEVLSDMGLIVINVDVEAGMVEATATSFWFGFKDDVAVRVVAADTGSVVDLRSISRVGRSDVGVNAARILTFSHAF